MRKTSLQRALSLVLALLMLCSLAPVPAFATGTTIAGAAETVKVGQSAADRENDFNKDWKFYLGDNSSASNKNFDDSGWKNVNLPHDFSITQNFTSSGEAESGFLPGGTGWYRKSFVLDQTVEGKTFLLNFDGVYMHAYVYVNGTFVGEHHYGYTNFAFDITDHLICDGVTENVIAVKAVNQLPSSRWYSGSGIYRDVTLYILDPVHVDLHGIKVTTPDVANGSGAANVAATLVNDSNADVSAAVKTTIIDKYSGTAVGSAETTVNVPANGTAVANTAPAASDYALWSIENPNLYTMKVEVSVNGSVVDTETTDFGYRWFQFTSDGFQLNGKAVKLNGVCMHHDQGGLGSAAYYDAIYRQMSIMKDMGANAIRVTHNPADEDLIAICNKLGLLVIEETFDGLVDPKNENCNDFSGYFEDAASSGLYGYTSGMTCAEYASRAHVKRDRNAPSVIAWSFGNEIQEGTYWNNVGRYDDICASYIGWVNAVDGTRPVTSGDNNRGGDSRLVDVIRTITNAGGIAGFNYANSASTLYSLAQNYGGSTGSIIASETSSATNSRGQYRNQNSNTNSDGKYHLTSYDTSSVSWGITAHDSIYNTYQYDCVAGEFVWTGFDYIGEPTPWNGTTSGDSGRGAIPNSSYFGIVETTGFEKDSFYLYRSQWNKNATTVHLVTAWDSDNMMTSGGKTPVWLYSNAPKVELYLNGTKIATATRSERTSAAGHTYYTYTSTSNNSACSVSNGSGADALYAVFNVAYTAGTLSAKAYDANGNEIALNDSMGRYTVSTPGSVTQLKASVNKTEIAADGSSLAYVEIDVLDANGNPDTTATNNITFTLTGSGEIAAVDNGDQATTQKYQNSSVLTSRTQANINAYAGKALVILRSTEDAGTMTLNIASDGLSGQSITVRTTGSSESTATGLVSYTMVRDYTVKAGTVPALLTTATATLADGTTANGTIAWEPVSSDTHGDYTVYGNLSFAGYEPIRVSAKLHVIPNVIALRNVAAATMEGTLPILPNTVSGVMADGTLAGEFAVTWNAPAASEYDVVGETVTVTGSAAIFGEETMEVTCTVRVAEAVNTESTNVAPMADSLTQDIAAGYQSDNLASIKNGTLKPGDNTNERWTNWNNRTRSADATLTLTWATAQTVSGVNLYYYYDNCCAYPEALEFSYSLNGQEYQVIGHTAEQVETYSLGAMYTYTFDKPINPVGLKIKLTQKNGTSGSNCVGLTELEVMTYAASITANSSADLAGIAVEGTAVEGFAADTYAYEVAGGAVTAETSVNAGITVLPACENVIRILTVSEDGTAAKTYELTVRAAETECEHANTEELNVAPSCTTVGYTGRIICSDCQEVIEPGTEIPAGHQNTEVRVTVAATCTVDGYGDTYCLDCGECIETETVISATGHKNTVLQGAVDATCTVEGYTGDTYCNDCSQTVTYGSVIGVKEHAWDDGVITQEPTETAAGTKTYTCTGCGTTKTEDVPYQKELKAPTVSLNLSKNSSGKIVITGKVDDYENLGEYYEITAHGLLYIQKSRIGTRVLTRNTSGRTNVNCSGYKADGSFTYSMKPANKTTTYAFRAYVTYTDPATGSPVNVYSDMLVSSFNNIAN